MIRFLRVMLVAGVILSSAQIARAATTDEETLRDQLTQYYNQTHLGRMQPRVINAGEWRTVADQISTDKPSWGASCVDAQKTVILGQYVLTVDSAKNPCHIYDLTFPTLQTLFAGRAVAQVPVQSFNAGDYLNLIRGNYSAVVGKRQNFTVQPSELSSWVKDIKFRPQRMHALKAQPQVAGVGLPKSFFASDIQTGPTLKFSDEDQASLLQALQAAGVSGVDLSAWQSFVRNPESVLSNIHFSWNDAEKVFDVFIEGQFLPIRGPIALVDFQAPYKMAVEGILRSVVHSALNTALGYMPVPAKNIIQIALDDSFEFLDMAYDYQLNRLEGSLAYANSSMDAATMNHALNLVGAARASFVTEYITATVTGQTFDWSQLEDSGRKIRYDNSTARDAEISKLNSGFVLDQGCDMQIQRDYFGVCQKDGKRSMYSMISENSVLFWNLGAPMVYNYEFTSEVMLKRSAGYILSVGARLVELPYVGFLIGQLASACKTFAFAGISDEGFLRSSLNVQKNQAGHFDTESQSLSNWVYLQNLNGFLPKTEAIENSVIEANSRLLGLAPTTH